MRQEPYEKFAAVAAGTGDACRMFVAWYHGRPVAASIMLVHGQHAVGWRSYSISELAAPVSAHLLTQVTGIEDAVSSGCRSIDLGQSGGAEDLEREGTSLGAVRGRSWTCGSSRLGWPGCGPSGTRAEGVLARALTRSSGRSTLGQPSLSRLALRGAATHPPAPSDSDSLRPRASVYLCASVPARVAEPAPPL